MDFNSSNLAVQVWIVYIFVLIVNMHYFLLPINKSFFCTASWSYVFLWDHFPLVSKVLSVFCNADLPAKHLSVLNFLKIVLFCLHFLKNNFERCRILGSIFFRHFKCQSIVVLFLRFSVEESEVSVGFCLILFSCSRLNF